MAEKIYEKGVDGPVGLRPDVEDQKLGEVEVEAGGELRRGIKSRQAQMMALGGVIGTGFFVGSGQALATSGPAFLFLAYIIISVLLYGIMSAITEIAAYLPIPGCSVAYYAHRFVSPSLGWILGWMYWFTFAIMPGYEVTAAAIVISYWPNDVPLVALITVMLFVVIALNFLPVRVFSEAEFWFCSLKVFTIIGLLIMSFILFWGGGPDHTRLGFWYWQEPGATNEYLVTGSAGRFCAFLFAVIYSVFSVNFGPELLVISAGEMAAPRRDLPRAGKHFVLRLVIFFVLGSLAISVICPSDAPALTDGGVGAAASPFVVGIKNSGIRVLDSIVNAVFVTAAWSAGNAQMFMGSRQLYSMAVAGDAPKIFTRCNRWGVPYIAVTCTALPALLAYLNVSNAPSKVFSWFVNLVNCAGFISWICCCIVFLRFRKACLAHGITGEDTPYRSRTQPYLAWTCLISFSIMLLLNGFSVFFPGHWSVSSFLAAYIGIPVFLFLYAVHRVLRWSDPWVRSSEDVDMFTGLDEVLATEARNAEAEPVKQKKWWYAIQAIWS